MTEIGRRLRAYSAEDRRYVLGELPRNLAEAGESNQLLTLLFDFDFLLAKVRALGMGALDADLERAIPVVPEEHRRAVETVRRAVRSGAAPVTRDPGQLASQLVGRLDVTASDLVENLVRAATAWDEQPWLCTVAPTLESGLATLLRVFVHPGGTVGVATLSADGRVVLLGCDLGTVSIWRVDDPDPPAVWHGSGAVTAAALSTDGELAVWADGHAIRRWSPRDEAAPSVLADQVGGFVATALDDPTANVLLAHTNGSVVSFHLATGDYDVYREEESPVLGIAADGRHAILLSLRSARDPDLIPIQSASEPARVQLAPTEKNQFSIWHIHDDDQRTCAFGADTPGALLDITGVSRLWATTRQGARTWDFNAILSGEHGVPTTDPTTCLALSHSGEWAIAGRAGGALRTVRVFKDPQVVTRAHQGSWPVAVAISDDGRRALAASRNGAVALWDLAEQRDERAVAWGAAAVTADARVLVGSSDESGFWIRDERHPGSPRQLQDAQVTSVALARDGGRVAWTSMLYGLRLLDLDRQEDEPRAVPLSLGSAVAFSPGGGLVVAGSLDSGLYVCDFASGSETGPPIEVDGWIESVAVSATGVILIGTRDHGVLLHAIGSSVAAASFGDVGDWVAAVGISADAERAVIAERDGTVSVFELAGETATRIEGFTMPAPVMLAKMTDDGRMTLIACEDGTVELHEVGGVSASFVATGRIVAGAIGPGDPVRVTCLDASGALHELMLRGVIMAS